MSAKTITVVATAKAKPGREAELKSALFSLIAPTRREAGCLNYDMHSSPEDPTKFLFHENWTSRAHLDAHLKTAHFQAVAARFSELCAGPPEINVWEKIAYSN
jgi:quinol monooxygenase YgiN